MVEGHTTAQCEAQGAVEWREHPQLLSDFPAQETKASHDTLSIGCPVSLHFQPCFAARRKVQQSSIAPRLDLLAPA